MFQHLMLLQEADAKAHIQIPVIAERAEICGRLAGRKADFSIREFWMGSRLMSRSCKKRPSAKADAKIPAGQSAANKRVRRAKNTVGKIKKHFEKFLKPGISATGNFTVRDPGIRIGKKKITGKNAITENDLEKRCMKPWMNYEPRSRKEILSWGQKTETLK